MTPEIICFIIFINIIHCQIGIQPQNKSLPQGDAVKHPDNVVVVNINQEKVKPILKNISTVTSSTPTNGPVKSNDYSYVESGAVMRGVFVFVAITLLFIMYLVYKTYRKGNRKQVAIKKYGVRARRTDTEMEPLHLDDEEDDETLFVRNVNR